MKKSENVVGVQKKQSELTLKKRRIRKKLNVFGQGSFTPEVGRKMKRMSRGYNLLSIKRILL